MCKTLKKFVYTVQQKWYNKIEGVQNNLQVSVEKYVKFIDFYSFVQLKLSFFQIKQLYILT